MRFRTVFFDLDGTLVDHFAAIHRSHCHTMRALGLPEPTREQVMHAVGAGVKTAIQRILGPAHADRLEEAFPIYHEYWERTMLDDVHLFPGARELLRSLHDRGVTNAVLTNKHGPSSRRICDHLGLTPLLAGVFGAFDTPWLKPDPAFARHALDKLGADAASSCLVGDSIYDVQAGHQAGFPCFVVTTGTHTAAELTAAGAEGVHPDLPTLGHAHLGV